LQSYVANTLPFKSIQRYEFERCNCMKNFPFLFVSILLQVDRSSSNLLKIEIRYNLNDKNLDIHEKNILSMKLLPMKI